MDLTIEPLDATEWARLRALRLSALQENPEAFGSTYEDSTTWTIDQWKQQAQAFPTFFARGVIEDKPRDVGMVRYADHASRPDTGYLISMWVAPVARRQGAGRALIDAVRGLAIDKGKRTLLLDVREGNASAIALYESAGFEFTGQRVREPPPHRDVFELEYALQLTP